MSEEDSGLYADLYGADESNFQAALATSDPFEVDLKTLRDSTAPVAYDTAPVEDTKATRNSENLQPVDASKSSDASSSVSYSAQIAKQFSAYSQTPSQERQQRFNPIPTYSSGPQNGGQSIASGSSHETRTHSATMANPQIKPSDMKDEGKMFIGGLSWDTTDGNVLSFFEALFIADNIARLSETLEIKDGLNEYFGQYGKIDASVILRDPEGRSRGFAFLTFENPSSVDAVLNQSHILDGKTIDPKRAIPKSSHQRAQRFFIGGLAPTSTTDSLKKFFIGQFGNVIDVNVMMDRETGRNKGYAFVTFEDLPEHEASRVMAGGWEIDGKTVEIKYATPRPPKSNREYQNAAAGGSITSYSSDSRRTASSAPNVNGRMGNGLGQPTQQQDMSALYQRMMGRMGGMMANSNVGMMYNGGGMGGMGGMSGNGMGMNMGGMNMGGGGAGMNGGMMNGMMNGMAQGGMPRMMGMGMQGGGGMGNMNSANGMGMGMLPQNMSNMGGMGMNMAGNMQLQSSGMGMAMSGMQGGGTGGGGPTSNGNTGLRLGSGPLTAGMGNMGSISMVPGGMGAMNMGNLMGTGRGRGMQGVGPTRTGSRSGHFHPYSR